MIAHAQGVVITASMVRVRASVVSTIKPFVLYQDWQIARREINNPKEAINFLELSDYGSRPKSRSARPKSIRGFIGGFETRRSESWWNQRQFPAISIPLKIDQRDDVI